MNYLFIMFYLINDVVCPQNPLRISSCLGNNISILLYKIIQYTFLTCFGDAVESLVVALQWRCTVNVLYSTDPFRKQVCSSVCSGSQTSWLEVRFTWYRPVCYGWTFIWVVELQWPFDRGLLSYIVSLLQNCFTGNYQIGGRTH